LNYYLASAPERLDPSDRQCPPESTLKVLGGVMPVCAQLATAGLNGQVVDQVVTVVSTREAEMAKSVEKTYRHNIALVNEMATFCHEMDINALGWHV
jgi:UDP-N-acetyl-D-mannosaminuronate dehydrogenase